MSRVWVPAVIVALIVLLLASGIPPNGAHAPPSVRGTPSNEASILASATPNIDPPANAFETGMAASVVLGAPNFTSTWGSTNASAFASYPEYSTTDAFGDVWTTDFGANRVLEFTPPFTNGEAASIVLGQDNFTGYQPGVSAVNMSSPAGTAFDAQGDLWVADWGNNRVLEFDPPFHTGMAASLVLGQSTFTTSSSATTASNLDLPVGPTFDAQGNLWVADEESNRVLEFRPPFTTGMAASLVIGQSNFTGSFPGLSATNLSSPQEAIATPTELWVADYANNRVLGYPAPFQTGESANVVLGQSSFTTGGSSGEAAFESSTGVAVDQFGDLWVTDGGDSRVLEFTPPFSTFEDPSVAIGQSSLTGTAFGLNATSLEFPQSSFFAPDGDLWVTDAGNNRLLEFVPPHYTVTLTPSGLPVGTSWTASLNGADQSGTGALPFAAVNGSYFAQVTPVPGFRADPAFATIEVAGASVSLVVRFSPTGPNPISPGMPATVVLGQTNFETVNEPSSVNASDLGANWGAAVDANGDLWVVDAHHNRVLEFQPPFSNFMAASLVIGQSNFSGGEPGLTATNLSDPNEVAFDGSGDLWVSDSGNNRILEFKPPFSSGMSASFVLGQPNFTAGGGGANATALDYPFGMAFEGANLWVADSENNRILEFLAPFTTEESASLVLGQSNFTGTEGGTTATNLSDASWLALDARGDMWVSDWFGDRVVEYPSPLSTGEAASVVLGQPNLTTSNSTFPDSLDRPAGIWIDGAGNLWVTDSSNNRVLEYVGPAQSLASNATPSLVLGQSNLTTDAGATSQTGLREPTAVVVSPTGGVWVVDDQNLRVVGYLPTQYPVGFSETGLLPGTTWGVAVNGTPVSTSAASTTVPLNNGTYRWTANAVPGYVLSANATGTITVSGRSVNESVTYVRVTYSLTFTEIGLPSGTTWSVTVAGVPHSSVSTTIALTEPNGSYSFSVAAVAGFTIANMSGTVEISGAGVNQIITFSATVSPPGTPSSPASGFSTLDLVLVVVVVLAVVGILAAVLLRRRKGQTPPASPGMMPSPGVSGAPPPPPPPGPPPPSNR